MIPSFPSFIKYSKMRKNRSFACRGISLLLVLLTLLLTACQGGSGDLSVGTSAEAINEGEAPLLLSIIENGASDYVIVVPQGDVKTLTVAYAFRTKLQELTGVKLSVVKDSEAATEKEILLGRTNRTVGDFAVVGADDYLVSVINGKLTVLGGSAEALMLAVDRLVEECCSDGMLRLLSTYGFQSLKSYLQLVCGMESEYVFVVNKDRSSDYDIAYYLQSQIRGSTGVRIKIVYDNAAPQDKEILIGAPNREEANAVLNGFATELDYYVGVVGEKLLICAESQTALQDAAEWFEQNYILEGEVAPVSSELQHYNGVTGYEALALSINNRYEGNRGTLETLERVSVYAPSDSWWFNHGAAISMINGVLVAVWSQGRLNEGDVGQRIAYSISTDFEHWSPMQPLVDTWQGEHSEMVLGVDGVYNNGTQLVVYFGASEYKKEVLRENGTLRPVEDGNRVTYGLFYVTTEDGVHWSEPQRYSTDGGRMQGPIPMGNGELLWAGGHKHAFTSDLTGLTWTGASMVDKDYALSEGARMLTESSFIVKDGVVYMFSRSGGNLWVSFSSDWGRTWSLPYQTNFTDASSKFMCGQLPDGRYYFVSNPGPNTSEGNRLPLTIAISSDGINWSEQYILGDTPRVQRMEGMYKGGHYAYPNCFIGDDGYFYVIYSVHKEDIEVVRFKLQELGIASSEQN